MSGTLFDKAIDGREGLILFFKVGGYRFGIRLTDVTRIDESVESEQDDDLLKRINLREFFGCAKADLENAQGIVIVIMGEDGQYGLVADSVDRIVAAVGASELSWPKRLDGDWAKIYGGFFRDGEKLIPALNVSEILEIAVGESR